MTDIVTPRRKTRKPPLQAQLRLLEWGPRGSVRARLDERPVQVDRGIPGELADVSIVRGRRPWRGVVEHPVEPSPHRIAPPCPYYLRGCGGCQWQHMDYAAQLETKRFLVDREMEEAGVDARVMSVHAPADPWRYRRTAAVALGWEAGFRPRGRRGIVEVHDCLISHPLVGRLADACNDLLRSGHLPNYHGKVWLDCTVVGSELEPRLQVLIQGIAGLTLESHPELPEVAGILAEIPGVGSVAFRHRSGRPEPLVGPLGDTVEVGGRPVCLPAGSFFQTNLPMLERLIARLRGELAGQPAGVAADIYGGVGVFALYLADLCRRVTLVELDPLAVEAAERSAAAWQLDNLEFLSRHAERALPELPALDLAVVDPPRSGLDPQVINALAANGVPRLFYVSCAPASLARDLALLQARGFAIRSLEIFDFYPQTYHVESLAILER